MYPGSSAAFPGVHTGVCSEAGGSSPASVAREDRVFASLADLPNRGVAAVKFDPDDPFLYFRWKRQMPE